MIWVSLELAWKLDSKTIYRIEKYWKLGKLRSKIVFSLTKFHYKYSKKCFFGITQSNFNISPFCKLFWTPGFKPVQWIPILLGFWNITGLFIIKPHLRGTLQNFVKNVFYKHALEFQVKYYFASVKWFRKKLH